MNQSSTVDPSSFLRVVAAYFISSVGDWLYKLALPLLVLQLTGSAVDMAGTFALTYLPFLLFSLVGGVVADRYQRKRVLVGCDLAAGVCLLMVIVGSSQWQSMPIVYLFVFLAASVTPIHHPSFQSFIPEVVAKEDLARANALISGSENVIAIVAPLVSGVLIAAIGVTSAILLNAFSFFISAMLVASLQVKQVPKRAIEDRSFLVILKEGFGYAWSHPVLKYGSMLFVGSNFAIHVFQANLVFYLTDILNSSSGMVGVVFALTGVGAVIGSAIAPALIKRFQSGHIIIGATISAGLVTCPLLLVRDPVWIGIFWGAETVFGTINMVTYFTLRQRSVPQHILGRAVAITRLISFSSIPIAALLGGVLVTQAGIQSVIAICAGVRLATGLMAMFTPLMTYRTPQAA